MVSLRVLDKPSPTAADGTAWYFWNTQTGEVTWTNPLVPPGSADASSSTPSGAAGATPPLPAGPPPPAAAQPDLSLAPPPDIDPALAHLLPPDQRYAAAQSGGVPGGQTALFNARTGRFTAKDYQYTTDHMSEYNRAKRMNSHYFDVDAWEAQKNEEYLKRKRDEEAGRTGNKAAKQVTRKDMVRARFVLVDGELTQRRSASERRPQRRKFAVRRGLETRPCITTLLYYIYRV